MDTSNPIMSADRRTIAEIMESTKRRRRQDLEYIAGVAKTTQRVVLPVNSTKLPLTEVREICGEFNSSISSVPNVKDGDLPEDLFEVVFEEVPVCGLQDELGLPIHPAGVNNSKGKLCVNRVMGGSAGSPLGLADIVEVVGEQVLKRTHVYTGGTWEGFITRMREQMGRKTVPLRKTLAVAGKEVSYEYALRELDKYMPRSRNSNWPGVHTNLYDALTEGIKITANSSAGAPYWRNKGECMDHILDVGIPVLVEAIKSNTVGKLFAEQPEMFVAEVKNKLDRYELDKLSSKTRPYVCMPAHFAFLFSMLTQGFQETLEVFDKEGTRSSNSNAYGFSSANGGLARMVEWMRTADKRGKVICYGDDAKIVVKRGGKIFCVDPDFKQMDGSLDHDDIKLTIAWVLKHLKQDAGEDKTPYFWEAVANLWLLNATQPLFVLDGKKVYRKKSPNGLMTGVPGTTLFDTVKSVLAWNAYLDHCEMSGADALNEDNATSYMAAQGLVIKPGTWNPAELPEAKDGVLMTDHKFLGVQILCKEWEGRLVYAPTIPEEEAIQMMVVQKDNPYEKVRSMTVQARTAYDRMRGYMITCGFTIPLMKDCIHNVVNNLRPEVILMDVQAVGGEKPDHILLQDFAYPDSSGFPSEDFCWALYAGDKEKAKWTQLFPDLHGRLDLFKTEERVWGKRLRAVTQDIGLCGDAEGRFRKVVKLAPVPEPDIDPALGDPVMFEKPHPLVIKDPNPRSFIARVVDSQHLIPEKRQKTRGEAILCFLADRGGLASVREVCDEFGMNGQQLYLEAKRYAFFVTGLHAEALVSQCAVQTPAKTIQDVIVKENREMPIGVTNKGKVRSFPKAHESGAPKVMIETSPEVISLDSAAVMRMASGLREGSRLMSLLRKKMDAAEALRTLQPVVSAYYHNMRWKTLPVVHVADRVTVGVTLLVDELVRVPLEELTSSDLGNPKVKTFVMAECWSLNALLAKQYIAKAVLGMMGADFVETSMSTRFVPPPREFCSWADECDYAVTKSKDPVVVPIARTEPIGVPDDQRERLYQTLSDAHPEIEPRRVRAAVDLAFFHWEERQRKAKTVVSASQLLQSVSSSARMWLQKMRDLETRTVGTEVATPQTSGSKLNDYQKKRKNLKNNLRRRRQMKEARAKRPL